MIEKGRRRSAEVRIKNYEWRRKERGPSALLRTGKIARSKGNVDKEKRKKCCASGEIGV